MLTGKRNRRPNGLLLLFIMCVEPFTRICHWGPLVALAIVKCICLMSFHCLTMWWPPSGSLGGMLHSVVFAAWNGLVLYHFFTAMFIGPGYVPRGWKPDEPEDLRYLQYCHQCQGYKAPRAHHCRRCQRCVLKMDHHCPWINNCCGYKNHANFTLFLFFAVCGCIHASVILSCSVYRAVYRTWHVIHRRPPFVFMEVNGFLLALFALGLAIGVIIAVGMLFIIQMKCIIKNETSIDSWIIAKANRPRPPGDVFIYPYNLGWKDNLKQVFCRKEEYDDDEGIYWPVKEGCNQYTLTIEQIQQKQDKRSKMREYTITETYSGAWFPISKGIKVCASPPCSDDPRIPVVVGDKVLVSRWKRHWLYGDKIYSASDDIVIQEFSRQRGWFPRRCAVEIINGSLDGHFKKLDKKNKKKD